MPIDAPVQLFSLFAVGILLVLLAGLYAVMVSRNLVRVLIGLEVLTKGVTALLIVCGYTGGQIALAQSLAITLIVIEVAVIVVAVSIVLCVFKETGSLDVRNLRNLKG